MTHKTVDLSATDIKNIAAAYTSDNDRKNQLELALQYNCAPVTIRRALAEAGVLKLKNYKTAKEDALLHFLTSQGLDDISRLRDFVVKARTGNSAA